ncbi:MULTISPECIES: sigma-70 family RNA polymerase sigma factor [Nitrospirillum]|uniref:RNA polymerase sigma-70 factor (ECF subfamily) n=1 Tax=Nitrospirillum amazonense TaxID=28077 RepID=A0A560FAF3_9PROT|nr:sigma-70 family RNA polymerase sigma factor [Nitrospirillum amazonense]MEC4593026.1 sigma-70 family RNA polymerase sigma factor [Nitrospirillum amazonense]TWB18597.1 RNA polymerase sigma-70 factor (ECF subfamily) [Nitrospirillum amazonense]
MPQSSSAQAIDEASAVTALLLSTATGDRAAFGALYQAAAPILYGICLRLTRDRDRATDLLQDVFVRIWQKAPLFDPTRGSAFAWMAVLTRNHVLSLLDKPIGDTMSLDDEAVLAAVDGRLAQQPDPELALDLERCLGLLTERSRRLVLLTYLQGLTFEELAERVGAPLGSVKSWVRRAVLKLKECLA